MPNLWLFILPFALLGLAVVALLLIFPSVRQWFTNNKDLIQSVASLLGVLAIFAAVLGLYFSYQSQKATAEQQQKTAEQQQKTAEQQSESGASSFLQDHLKLATEHPNLSTVLPPDVVDARFDDPEEAMSDPTSADLSADYAFFASHAMFAAENIYRLMDNQSWASQDWQNTVNVLIWRHNTYVCHESAFNKDEYTQRFNELIDTLRQQGLCGREDILRTS